MLTAATVTIPVPPMGSIHYAVRRHCCPDAGCTMMYSLFLFNLLPDLHSYTRYTIQWLSSIDGSVVLLRYCFLRSHSVG